MAQRKERIDRGIKARSSDIFALTSWREMLYLAAPRLLPVVGLIVLSFTLSIYWQRVLLSVSIFALLAISWDILAQTIPLATIVGGLLCTAFLIPVLRLRGIFFSMVTLVLPLMLVRIIEASRIFGGTEGLSGLTALPSRWVEIYVLIIVLLSALFGFRRMMNSDFGLILKAINDNDRSVMNAGINVYWFKIQALFIASSIGAFAGAFLTHIYLGHLFWCLFQKFCEDWEVSEL
jgi:branched-chain amino acid transport system permease protein